jgi:hypothetical protein
MNPELNLVYEQQWSTYEEWGGIRIYEDSDGYFHYQCGGHCVYSSPNDPTWEELEIISGHTVLDLIDEWEQIAQENEERWENSGI